MVRSFVLIFAAFSLHFEIPQGVVAGFALDDPYPIISVVVLGAEPAGYGVMMRRRGDATRALLDVRTDAPKREGR